MPSNDVVLFIFNAGAVLLIPLIAFFAASMASAALGADQSRLLSFSLGKK